MNLEVWVDGEEGEEDIMNKVKRSFYIIYTLKLPFPSPFLGVGLGGGENH